MGAINPLIGIFIFFLAVGGILYVFWPDKGLRAKLIRLNLDKNRVLLEDALKFLYNCEYMGRPVGLSNLARNLAISKEKTEKLLKRLQSMELIMEEEKGYSLSDAGRSYALRIIRVHRIWERYLADESGWDHAEWHEKAEFMEHKISGDKIEKLAAKIGNPVFDPHGAPIPTADGKLPELKGKPLYNLKEGDIARIVNIEDKPVDIYKQLVAEGLYPGLLVYVLKVEKEKIIFEAAGEECTLIPQFAAAVTVESVKEEKRVSEKTKKLSSLKIGEKAEIAGISPNFRGPQRRRLMDLGIVPGSRVSAIMKSASGDPVGYRIMGTTIGIRKSQADQIFIRDKEKESHEYSK